MAFRTVHLVNGLIKHYGWSEVFFKASDVMFNIDVSCNFIAINMTYYSEYRILGEAEFPCHILAPPIFSVYGTYTLSGFEGYSSFLIHHRLVNMRSIHFLISLCQAFQILPSFRYRFLLESPGEFISSPPMFFRSRGPSSLSIGQACLVSFLSKGGGEAGHVA